MIHINMSNNYTRINRVVHELILLSYLISEQGNVALPDKQIYNILLGISTVKETLFELRKIRQRGAK